MTASPVVSVLLPVRDGAAFLDECIDSLSAQTFEDFEVIAVDDGSTDGTPDRLAAWAAADPRVQLLRMEATGIAGALERARASARGTYLARMDADDVARPTRLEAQLALMEANPDLSGCGCLVRYFPDSVVRDGARRYQTWLNAQVTSEAIAAAMYVECPLAHPTFFLRAAALERVGGYRERGWPEDYDLILRMHQAGLRLGKVPEELHLWRERPERLSRVDPRYAPEAFLACRVHYLRLGPLAGGRGAVIWGAGPVGKGLARALIRAGTPVVAFVELDPRKIGQEIHGAPVLTPEEALGRTLVEARATRLQHGGPDGAPTPALWAGDAAPLHLAAVGQKGARRRILSTLVEGGLTPLTDFLAVA